MGNCALAYFETECEEELKKRGFFDRLIFGIRNNKSKMRFEPFVEKLFEADEFIMYAVRLPFKQSSYKEMKAKSLQRANDQLRLICEQNRIYSCYLPRTALCLPEYCSKSGYYGEWLFKFLLKDLLDLIYTKRGIKIGDLNITIVEGEDSRELGSLLEVVAPYVKYISVLSDRRKQVEDLTESLYEKYGLSIGVSQDYRNGLKYANLVINLGRLEGFPFRPRFGVNTVVINYGRLDSSYIPPAVTVINGIEAGLPGNGFKMLVDQPQSFTANEIVELLLLNKLNITEIPPAADHYLIEAVSREFKRCGLTILKLKGKYNTIGINDVNVV